MAPRRRPTLSAGSGMGLGEGSGMGLGTGNTGGNRGSSMRHEPYMRRDDGLGLHPDHHSVPEHSSPASEQQPKSLPGWLLDVPHCP